MLADTQLTPETPALIHRRIRVIVVDEGIFLEGLCALLGSDATIEVVGAVSSGRDALRMLASSESTVIVMDFSTSMKTGPETITQFKRLSAATRVLVLTSRGDDQLVDAALLAGAEGYILKSDGRAELFAAIRNVADGRGHLSASLTARPADREDSARSRGPSAGLTPREREIIALIAKGYRTQEMAQLLSLTHKTVEKHQISLMRKLGLHSAAAVVTYAVEHGYA